jgi:hypothetical protein
MANLLNDGPAEPLTAGRYLNAGHPLNVWLIANTETLAADFPVLFQRVFVAADQLIEPEHVNAALERVARSRPDLAPQPEAYLREDSKGWWWSR